MLSTLAALAVAGAVSPAAAAAPCWERLLTDWSDGAITSAYPVGCYRDALRNLPEDVRLYSSAASDIRRALAARVTVRRPAGAVDDRASVAETIDAEGRGTPVPLVLGSLVGVTAALTLGAILARRRLTSTRGFRSG